MAKSHDIRMVFAFDQRRLNLGATPSKGTAITSVDLDLTLACNLRCSYCFKEKRNEHMENHVAFDALVWLLYASGSATDLTVNFMGGEPLLRFDLIQRIVPFGKRRAWQMGKTMHFGATTNGTLVTDEVVSFWKNWGMGFHTSIDGAPDSQNRNRPMVSGQGSAWLVEQAVQRVLAYRPETCARCTIVPETAASLVRNYQYFRTLGYTNIAMVFGVLNSWSKETIAASERELYELADILIGEFRNGRSICVFAIDQAIQGIVGKGRPRQRCGAGRGMVLVDIHGDIWPCHRWNKASEAAWRIGNIYGHFDETARGELLREAQRGLMDENCRGCLASSFCDVGCSSENLEDTGNPNKRHPNGCELTRLWASVGRKVHDVLYAERNLTFLKQYYAEGANANATAAPT